MKFRRIKVGKPDFDPGPGISRLTNAEAIAVTNIAHQTLKFLPGR
jgi:hypothetical protein